MQHKGTKTIETKRLILRKFNKLDGVYMFKNWAGDSNVCKFLSWPPYENVGAVQNKVHEWVESYEDASFYNWAIVLKEMNEVIGSIGVVESTDNNMHCEVGYCIGKAFWGQGIMTEAHCAVMEFLFYEVGYHRIQARHDVQNRASGIVMQKSGMQFEGIMRDANIRRDGSFCDYAVYARLSTDAVMNNERTL